MAPGGLKKETPRERLLVRGRCIVQILAHGCHVARGIYEIINGCAGTLRLRREISDFASGRFDGIRTVGTILVRLSA